MLFKNWKPMNFLYWTVSGIALFIFIYLLVKLLPVYGAFFSFLWNLLAPFLVALLIAYFLYPIILKMHKHNIPKGLAIIIIYVLFFGGLGYLLHRIFPMIIHQLSDLKVQLPHLIEMYRDFVYSLYEYTAFLPENVHDRMDELIQEIETYIENLLTDLVRGLTGIFDMIVFITVIPVLVFYFIKDYEKIKGYIKKWIPFKYQNQTSEICHAIDESLGRYIRGQLIVCLFISVAAFAVFRYLDINYALLLAIIMGVTNLIPYFGPIIGAVPAVAITATVSTKLIIVVLISVFVIQLIESNLLSPYIVGKSINIHPVAIIFALLLGGQLFGVIGMVIAVPLLTVLKVITSHILTARRYN
ncbi:AI-2E family transporter [Virgibacillus kekensis]|uniref:AI-2E family transporter n=1 Tax=Virgibacillus kekensis TaxID=202261 RepID=A0ABV9DJB7_9BACI